MGVPASPAPRAPGRYRADVAIVGAGVAGLYAATRLPPGLDVVIVDKGTPGRSGSSPWAQGGMAVALGPDDSPELHADDTVRAGDGLCDRLAVRTLTHEAPERIRDLLAMGAAFDRAAGREGSQDPADLHLAREGGQTVARSVHTADATGAEMVRVLRDAATPLVTRLAGTAIQLAQDDTGRATGLWVLHADEGLVLLEARAVLLASGGCGGLFAATTNQDTATGDGLTLAWLAGAAVRDVEFVQFHPTGLAVTGSWRFLLTEALRGAGATLHDVTGRRFLVDAHPDAELAPRHVVAKAILDQPEGAWLDATAIGGEQLASEFPTVLHGAREHGFDLATERVPVTPAAHYMVGGVRSDLDGRTSVPGLYAAGEVASTGIHGANRMAGNSLTEALVFGARAAEAIGRELPVLPHGDAGPAPDVREPRRSPEELADLRHRLRQAMWHGAGPVRSAAGMASLRHTLGDLLVELGPRVADPVHAELLHAVLASQLICASAQLRAESRGGHVREDHPGADDAWAGVHLEAVRPA
ncbi:MAG: FAD-binding protein [Actinobacteria bacterium]|nr:FAD-binding protein [Actinomycetota bacterium]